MIVGLNDGQLFISWFKSDFRLSFFNGIKPCLAGFNPAVFYVTFLPPLAQLKMTMRKRPSSSSPWLRSDGAASHINLVYTLSF